MARPTKHSACTIPGCARPHMAKGWCGSHYMLARKYGDPLYLEALAKQVCKAEGCSELATGRGGWCRPHYLKQRRETGIQVRRGVCSIESCGCPHEALGFCEDHYYRFKRYGDPNHPVSFRKGTGTINEEGYRVIYRNRQRVLEHRWVVAQFIGRELLPEENVHHLNGVRHDNRIENLELWSSSQPSGQRVIDKLAWAREIILLYGSIEETFACLPSHPTALLLTSSQQAGT